MNKHHFSLFMNKHRSFSLFINKHNFYSINGNFFNSMVRYILEVIYCKKTICKLYNKIKANLKKSNSLHLNLKFSLFSISIFFASKQLSSHFLQNMGHKFCLIDSDNDKYFLYKDLLKIISMEKVVNNYLRVFLARRVVLHCMV